jgi:hypothetical protein
MSSKRVISMDVGIRNLSIALLEYNYGEPTDSKPWENLTVLHWELVDVIEESGSKAKNAKTLNIHRVCNMLIDALLKRVSLLDGVSDILIEQQPISRFAGGRNVGSSRMKVVQHVILTFYEVYYRLHPDLVAPTIQAASSTNKLKCTIDPQNFCSEPDNTKYKTTYKQRKEKSVVL